MISLTTTQPQKLALLKRYIDVLKHLTKNKDIISQADKGGGIVIIDKDTHTHIYICIFCNGNISYERSELTC